MTIKVALVEYISPTDNEIFTSSGLLFSTRFVLITGHVLLPFLKQFQLDNWFSRYNHGVIHYDIFEQTATPKLNAILKNKDRLVSKSAKVVAGFICQNIIKSCRKHLKDWAIQFGNETFTTKEFLSLFFILEITTNAYSKTNKFELNEALSNLLNSAAQFAPNIGHEVFIESVPFGNSAFLNSYSQGIVSNIIGDNSCFLLTDCPSTPGSEGSPVFIKTKCKERFVVAVVISCVNWWKGEWVGLTLTASLGPLLMQLDKSFFTECNIRSNSLSLSTKLLETTTNCLFQVVSGYLWGTAILIDKQKGIFLTNSHVIESKQIILHWKSHQIQASLIYQTPKADIYDLAVLQCSPSAIANLLTLEALISIKAAHTGENVFAAGYPLFQFDLNPVPTVTKGSISQVHKGMLKTTCCVLPGASGGAVFRNSGELIGVLVSNVKVNETNVAYPRLNMAIPILAVYSILQDFIMTGDSKNLHRLHTKDSDVIREWNYLSSKL